jgi:hypothetical protein
MGKISHTLWRTQQMREINYEHLAKNIEEMINTLEYDSSRSAGKTKLNSDKLIDLYTLQERYSKMMNSTANSRKKEKVNG